ncbi:hypothetical protein Peur_064917 [Populus x canadensis]
MKARIEPLLLDRQRRAVWPMAAMAKLESYRPDKAHSLLNPLPKWASLRSRHGWIQAPWKKRMVIDSPFIFRHYSTSKAPLLSPSFCHTDHDVLHALDISKYFHLI